MKTEFLAVCVPDADKDNFHLIAFTNLRAILDEHYESYDYDSLILTNPEPSEMVTVTHEREVKNVAGNVVRKIFGFAVEFGIETESLTNRQFQDTITYLEQILNRLTEMLREDDWIKHLVKFYDDVLLESHLAKMREVHEVEMKLRQVLSLIYLSAFDNEDFYDLLRLDRIEPQKSKPKDSELMKAICENEFYHLTFGQYPRLNNKKDLKSHTELVEMLIRSSNFDDLKTTLLNNPIKDENDADIIKALMDTSPKIEDFRNCVAHNRKLSEDLLRNYNEAKEILNDRLKDYLQQFSVEELK